MEDLLLADGGGGGGSPAVYPRRCLPRFCGAAGFLLSHLGRHADRLPIGGGIDEAMVLPSLCRRVKRRNSYDMIPITS